MAGCHFALRLQKIKQTQQQNNNNNNIYWTHANDVYDSPGDGAKALA